MRIQFAFSLIILLLAASGCQAATEFPQVDITLNDRLYHLEIADTAERQRKGLMYREMLAQNAGMLFVYGEPTNLNIWMKNTLIPLAVLWLDEQARVIDIKVLYPCRRQQCPSFGPPRPSQYVIELPVSEARFFNIGDTLPQVKQWHLQR